MTNLVFIKQVKKKESTFAWQVSAGDRCRMYICTSVCMFVCNYTFVSVVPCQLLWWLNMAKCFRDVSLLSYAWPSLLVLLAFIWFVLCADMLILFFFLVMKFLIFSSSPCNYFSLTHFIFSFCLSANLVFCFQFFLNLLTNLTSGRSLRLQNA